VASLFFMARPTLRLSCLILTSYVLLMLSTNSRVKMAPMGWVCAAVAAATVDKMLPVIGAGGM